MRSVEARDGRSILYTIEHFPFLHMILLSLVDVFILFFLALDVSSTLMCFCLESPVRCLLGAFGSGTKCTFT